MNRRKITALLVTFAMIAGSVPAQVFAVENDDSSGVEITGETSGDHEDPSDNDTEDTGEDVTGGTPEEHPGEADDVPGEEPAETEPAETEPAEPVDEDASNDDTADLYGAPDELEPVLYEYAYYDASIGRTITKYRYCDDYILLSTVSDRDGLTLQSGKWYVLDSNRTYNNRIQINGDVSIILLNEYKMTCSKGIHVSKNGILNIYGQGIPNEDEDSPIDYSVPNAYKPDGSIALGQLYAEAYRCNDAAIGGDDHEQAGTINIYSGKIYAYSIASYGSAIGGGRGKEGESGNEGTAKAVNIYGGYVTAENNNYGSAIGGGAYAYASWQDGINIYGGVIEAKGHNGAGIGNGPESTGNKGDISIYGGYITATGEASSAGIGGGKEGSCPNVYIHDGIIRASSTGSQFTGAGIGSGAASDMSGEIHIYNGIIHATGIHGAGIGSGCEGNCSERITIDKGIIFASSESGAGIGGGKEGKGAKVTINGGAVQAISLGYDDEWSTYNKWMDYAMDAYSLQHNPGNDFAYFCMALFSCYYDALRDTKYCGAGIGGGYDASGDDVVINGGVVNAQTSMQYGCAAIGRGRTSDDDIVDGSLTLGSGLSVWVGNGRLSEPVKYNKRVGTCRENGAIIRPCDNTDHKICVRRDDDVHDYICSYCSEVLQTEEHKYDSDHNCYKCGKNATRVAVLYTYSDASGKMQAITDYDHYLGDEITVIECPDVPDGKTFEGWVIRFDPSDVGTIYKPGDKYLITDVDGRNVYGFDAVYYATKETYYIDSKGERREVTARIIDSTVDTLTDGWYVVEADTDSFIEGRGTGLIGNINVIVEDNASLTFGPDNDLNSNSSVLTIYGQEENSGYLKAGNVSRVNYVQYGGNCTYDSIEGTGSVRIAGGKFTCGTLSTDSWLYIDKGQADITSFQNNIKKLRLNWSDIEDYVHIGQVSEDTNVTIAEGKYFTDGTNVLSGNVTGADISGKMLVPYDDCGVRLAGHKLSLEGDIGVWFYMDIHPDVLAHDGVYLRFTVPTGDKTETRDIFVCDAPTEVIGGTTYRKFKCSVSAKDMGSVITAQVFDGDRTGYPYTFTVTDYAQYLIDHASENEAYAEAVPLVKAMLNYGAYSQRYFGTGENIECDPDAIAAVDPGTIGHPYEGGEVLPPDVTFVGSSLSLKSVPTLSLYFKSKEELTFKQDGVTVEKSSGGGYQVARIRNIAVRNLDKSITIRIYCGNGVGSLTYCPLTYCYNVLYSLGYSSSLEDVCKALYVYHKESEEYYKLSG